MAPSSILLVEDDELIRSLLADAFRESGLAVTEAASGDEARDILERGNRPDLIFSDVHMPGALNGVGLARYAHRNRPGLPVVLTSGNPNQEVLDLDGPFLAKPFRIGRALTLVLGLLHPDPPPQVAEPLSP